MSAATRSLDDLARMFNAYIRGWINYYGRYYKSALYPTLRHIDRILARWAHRKFKSLRRHRRRSQQWLARIARHQPDAVRSLAASAWTRPNNGSRMRREVSRTVLRARGGEIPPRDSPQHLRSQRTRGSAGDGEHHALHHSRLKLKVNEAKSAVARPQERKFLGFSFTAGPDIKRTIAPKSLERFKQQIRDITRRAKGVSIKTTMEELATVYAGLARLFRLLRNARGADRPHSLGPAATAGRSVAPMENTTAPSSGTHRKWGSQGELQEHGRQRPWSLASRPEQSSLFWALQCILQIARPAILVRSVLAQPLEPPYTDPYVRWCGRGGAARLPPIPILCA